MKAPIPPNPGLTTPNPPQATPRDSKRPQVKVFVRVKHKTTSCAPYKRQKIVSNTIITSYAVNLDNTNLRKQTNVHLLWGQASLIVEEKSSTKIDFNNSPNDYFGKRRKIFYNIETLNILESKVCLF